MIRPRDSLPSLAPGASRDFPALRRVLPFTLPYRLRMAGAMLTLLVSSATVLGLGQGLRRLVDEGFKSGDGATLDRAVLLLIGVVVLLAGSTFCRFYLVSWIGERVVADIRRAVFDRVIALSPSWRWSYGTNLVPFQNSVLWHGIAPARPHAEPCNPSNIARRPLTTRKVVA